MAQSSDTWAELVAVRDEIAQLVNAKADELQAASRAHTEAFTRQIQDAIHDIDETLKQDERRLADIVAARPLPALAIAFAVGLAIGVSLRSLR